MHHLTPFSALAGGVLIGLAASLLLLSHGRVAGVSGLFGGLFERGAPGEAGGRDRGTALWFLGGLVLAGVVARVVYPAALPAATSSLGLGALAGGLVGVGTQLGSGCTSGHGVCGLSRLSVRSLAATITFIAAGMLTVAVARALGGVS